MPDTKTTGNPSKTVSNQELAARLTRIEDALISLGADIQHVRAFVDGNADMMARARALTDPGSGVRGFLNRKPARK